MISNVCFVSNLVLIIEGLSTAQLMPDILRKADREQCWSSRDSYWDCVRGLMKDSDSNMPEKALIQKNCNNYRKQYEADCPDTWIRLFDQKQSFELFKSKKFEEDLKLSVRKGEK